MRLRPMEVLSASAIAVCCLALAIHANSTTPRPASGPMTSASDDVAAVVVEPAPTGRPRIEVVFVLDTTGSMSGLLEGAKEKIWAIANRLAAGEPRPDLRVGLVAYRDRGDEYVTRRFAFSDDMDAVYAELLSYQAGGGGDTEEHVGQGLHDALHGMQWSGGQDVLKLVFLVGDAPPHDDYQDGMDTAGLAAQAKAKGIVINTIQCGAMASTTAPWQRIAAATGGDFAKIAQDGGVVAVTTPFDAPLQALNNELAGTVLTWGSERAQQASQIKMGNRMNMSASNAAEAASYSARTSRMNDEDLLSALDGGKALADIPADELPKDMQAMTPEQKVAHVDGVRCKRGEILAKIREVSAQREAYLRDAERAAGVDAGFDGQVLEMLRRQASEIGVKY